MPLVKYFGPSRSDKRFVPGQIYDVAHVTHDGWTISMIRQHDGHAIVPAHHFEPAFVRAVRASRGLTNGTIYEVHDATSSDIRVHPDGFLYDRSRFEPVWDGPPAKPVAQPQRWRLAVAGIQLSSEILDRKPDVSVDPSGALVIRPDDGNLIIIAPGQWQHVQLEQLQTVEGD